MFLHTLPVFKYDTQTYLPTRSQVPRSDTVSVQLCIGRGKLKFSLNIQVANTLGFAVYIWSQWKPLNFLKAM